MIDSGDPRGFAIGPGNPPYGWVVGLPMYDFPELVDATDALWAAIASRLRATGIDAPQSLDRTMGHRELWRHPRLLLAQACEYPLSKATADPVRGVATPCYTAAGCEGSRYRSAIVVRTDDPADSVSALRGRRCIINERDSNSGMNLLRAALAPLAGGTRFFGSVSVSGSHKRSAEAVASGTADVAALDCVSYAHFQRLYPWVGERLRRLDWTPSSPSLPFITGRTMSDEGMAALRAALREVMADPSLEQIRERLLLGGVSCDRGDGRADDGPAKVYGEVLQQERNAIALGYRTLE